MSITFLFQVIQFSRTVLNQTIPFNVNTVSMSKTVLFQAIQFSISTQFSSTWPIDRTLSSTITQGQSWHGSEDNEELLRIPQSSGITETSPSDCLVSYLGHSLVGCLTPQQRCSLCILQLSRLDRLWFGLMFTLHLLLKRFWWWWICNC